MSDWFLITFGSGWVLCLLSVILIYLFKKNGVSYVSIFTKGSSVFGDLNNIVNPNKLKYIKILSVVGVLLIIFSLVVLLVSKS